MIHMPWPRFTIAYWWVMCQEEGMVAVNDPLGSGRSDCDFTSFHLKYLNKAINVAVNAVSVLNRTVQF